jgi:hypothetical protein
MTVFGELHQLGGSTEVDMYKMSVIGHISQQKTIRVLLDTGSSGDLLFIKKRVSNVHTLHKEGCSTIVGHFEWHLSNKKGGCY